MTNLFAELPDRHSEEIVDVLAESAAVRIERIVSTGQATPPGQWCDQERHEWVMVLRGRAGLHFEDTPEIVTLGPGDHAAIAPHRRHRVEWTDTTEPTVWLAVHYR